MFARVTIKDYLQFLVYGLEYRALVMEQMSHEKETKYLAEHPNVEDREDGYGVVLLNFCIRDLQGERAARIDFSSCHQPISPLFGGVTTAVTTAKMCLLFSHRCGSVAPHRQGKADH
jgi:hypothetical protein